MRSRRLAVMMTVPLLALAACGDPDAEAQESPLQELFGANQSPAEMRAKDLAFQESVAQCMRDEGWEYTPVDYTAQFNDTAYEDPSEPGYGDKYGYGVVRSYEIYEWPNLDEDGNYAEDSPMGGDTFVDPNQDYVMSLTMDEQEQYNEALSGTYDYAPTIDPVTGEEIYEAPPIEEQGCYGQANLEIYGDQPFNDQDFNDRFSALLEDLENDPAIEDAEIVWSDCMYDRDADYDFLAPQDTDSYMRRLLGEAKGLELVDVDPNTGLVVGTDDEYAVETFGNPDDGTYFGLAGTQRKLTEDEIAGLEATEVELWRTDQDCQDESGLSDLRRQLEQDLVDTIRGEFPDLVDDAAVGAVG